MSDLKNMKYDIKKTINADLLSRQTISGEHGLDGNGVYVTLAACPSIFPRSPPIGTMALPSSSSSA